METDGFMCLFVSCPHHSTDMEYSCGLGEDEAWFEWCHRKKNGFIDHDAELFKGGLEGIKRKAVREVVERVKKRVNDWCGEVIQEKGEDSDEWYELEPHAQRFIEILDEEVSRVNSGGARVERKEDEQNNHCAGTY